MSAWTLPSLRWNAHGSNVVHDELTRGKQERVIQVHKHVWRGLFHLIQGGAQFRKIACVIESDDKIVCLCEPLRDFPFKLRIRTGRVPQDGSSLCSWHQLFDHLETLCCGLGSRRNKSCEVPARVRQTVDETKFDKVSNPSRDNRNACCGAFSRLRSDRSAR